MRKIILYVIGCVGIGIACAGISFFIVHIVMKTETRQLGGVHFSISCTARAQQEFDRGVAYLHSFEYESARERFEFLTQQSIDLERAIEQLQQVTGELDALMERAFRETFEAIAEEFKSTFQILFGGGSAKLVLTDPENMTQTGVDVIARPPGKKQQGLALLSGGERSLTAAALMFAILKVRPTPFCILDETDAALDEANISRFRDMVKSLSEQTQFVIITHNRGTIEAADTIYGISMGNDSASRAISLKLEAERVAASEKSHVG